MKVSIITAALCSFFALVAPVYPGVTNHHSESVYFKTLAKKVNANPCVSWKAAFGSVGFLFNETKIPLSSSTANLTTLRLKRSGDVDKSYDWRKSGRIAPPEHQGSCGSCWAFASVHTLMDNIHIRGASPIRMSTQHVLECCTSRACGGCMGASDNAAGFDFLSRKFTIEQSCKSYKYYGSPISNSAYSQPGQQCSSNCHYPYHDIAVFSLPKFNMSGFIRLDSDVSQIQAALRNGPLLAAVELYGDFYSYSSGIYKHVDGPLLGYHSVEIVGYGNEAGNNYWIVKNSWGPDWGENGYFRIVAGNNEAMIEEHVISLVLNGQNKYLGLDEAFPSPIGGRSEAKLEDEDVQEVAKFIAHEVKLICQDGRFDTQDVEAVKYGEVYNVEKVHQASRKVIAGISYDLLVEVSLLGCSKRMYIQAEVNLPSSSKKYTLLQYNYIPPPSNSNALVSSYSLILMFIATVFLVLQRIQ